MDGSSQNTKNVCYTSKKGQNVTSIRVYGKNPMKTFLIHTKWQDSADLIEALTKQKQKNNLRLNKKVESMHSLTCCKTGDSSLLPYKNLKIYGSGTTWQPSDPQNTQYKKKIKLKKRRKNTKTRRKLNYHRRGVELR